MAAVIKSKLKSSACLDSSKESIKVLSEPGAFFASSCMTEVCEILGKKQSVDENGKKVRDLIKETAE